MTLRHSAAAAAIVAATGCGDNLAAPDAAPAPDAGWSDITGSWAHHFHPDNGEPSIEPFDLSGITVQAWVPGPDGALTAVPGTGDEDGRFLIEDVPEVPVTIQVAGTAVHTARRHIDLGSSYQGRSDWTITDTDSVLRLDADGLSPWAASDVLLMSSSSVGIDWVLFSDAEIAPQSTSLAGIDFLGPFPLIDSTKGDRVSFYQGREGVLGGTEYGYLESAYQADDVRFDPATTELSGQFDTIAKDQSFRVEWNVQAWTGFANQSHPDAFGFAGPMRLIVHPGTFIDYFYQPILLWVANPTDTLDLPYGDPYPSNWHRTVWADTLVAAEMFVPGHADSSFIYGYMIRSMPADEYGSGPISVALSPPRRLQINGSIAYQTLTGVGTSPEISWLPPSLGEAHGYRVEIYRFVDGDTFPTYVNTVVTDSTEVTIPPGLLVEGQPYGLVVVAVAAEEDFVARPYRFGSSRSEAPALSGVLIP